MFLCKEMKLRREVLHLLLRALRYKNCDIYISVRQNKFHSAEILPGKDETPSVLSYPFVNGCSAPAGDGYGRRLRRALNIRKEDQSLYLVRN